MAQILSGDPVAQKIVRRIKRQKVERRLKLAVVQVGQNAVSEKYIQEKEKVARSLGIEFEVSHFSSSLSQARLKKEVEKIGEDEKVTGMIVQLPLAKKFKTQEILDVIPLEKDVDVLSSASFGLWALGKFPIMPPTAKAILSLLEHYGISLEGKNVVLIGAGRLVGLPCALMLLHKKATFTVTHEKTKNIESFTKGAEILITGVGKAKLVRSSMVKKGVVVVDAGSSVEKGRSSGDVDFNNVVRKAKALTPVPGGVGPITVACLFENLAILARHAKT